MLLLCAERSDIQIVCSMYAKEHGASTTLTTITAAQSALSGCSMRKGRNPDEAHQAMIERP